VILCHSRSFQDRGLVIAVLVELTNCKMSTLCAVEPRDDVHGETEAQRAVCVRQANYFTPSTNAEEKKNGVCLIGDACS
jgi:hypothetical protein